MKLYEQLKLFTGGDSSELENQYNTWVKEMMEARSKVPILSNKPFNIISRRPLIRQYKGAETYALAIFYEYAELSESEQGPDKAGNFVGASAFPAQSRGKRR
jgi:hypothetical protein